MEVLRVLSLLVVVVSAGASVGPSSNSSLCTESRECLQYQLLCKTDEYEVRHYSPTLWVSTDAEAYFMGVGAAMAFRRLFQYITGENEGGYQIDMTAPVLVKIPEETTMWEPAIYTLSFPLPEAYQEKPPQPTNDKLYFTEMPDMDVYVRSYGGWMLSVTSRLQAHQLTKELDRVGAKYNCTHHYGVGYDSPLKLLNRHNEVWYVCEGKPVCSDPREPTPPHPPRPRTESPEESASPDTPSPQPPRDLSTTTSSPESPIQDPDSDSPPQDLPIALSLTAATSKPEDQSTRETSDVSEESTQETSHASEQSTQEATQSTSIQPKETTQDTNVSISEQRDQSTPTKATSDSSEEVTQSAPDPSRQSGNSTQEVPDSSEQSTHQGSPVPVEQSTQGILDSTELKTQSTPGLMEKSTRDTPVTTEKSA